MNLSPHFSRSEFECQCGCGFDSVDYELLTVLERVREHFREPVRVTSGCRCKAHNQSIGGSNKSKHIQARAVDFQVDGFYPDEVYQFLDKYAPDKYGLGVYSSWVHLDTRSEKARWDKR